MTQPTSDAITASATLVGMLLKSIATVTPEGLEWLNDIGVLGCMGMAIIFLIKDRAALLKELREARSKYDEQADEAREKYEAKLQEIADKAEQRATAHMCSNYKRHDDNLK